MCLIVFAYNMDSDYRLILGANRDEYYERPAKPLGFWEDAPHILAGRDLQGKGTWMGVSKNGRFAAVTNYRNPALVKKNTLSRGLLTVKCLTEKKTLKTVMQEIAEEKEMYNKFNLIAADKDNIYWYSNMFGRIKKLKPGIYALSNCFLDTKWYKTEKVKKGLQKILQKILQKKPEHFEEDIFEILSDTSKPSEDQLPDTGVGIETESFLSPVFIKGDVYGTRCSSVVLWKRDKEISFFEKGQDTFSNISIKAENSSGNNYE